jgi:hypothetical protein
MPAAGIAATDDGRDVKRSPRADRDIRVAVSAGEPRCGAHPHARARLRTGCELGIDSRESRRAIPIEIARHNKRRAACREPCHSGAWSARTAEVVDVDWQRASANALAGELQRALSMWYCDEKCLRDAIS